MTSAVGSAVFPRLTPSSVVIGRSPQQEPVDPIVAETERPLASVVFNPRIRFDNESRLIVQEFRNTATGEIDRSVPSERQLQAYIDAQKLRTGRTEPPLSDSASPASSGGTQARPTPAESPSPVATDRRSAEPIVRSVNVPTPVTPDVVVPIQSDSRFGPERTAPRPPVAPAPALAIQV